VLTLASSVARALRRLPERRFLTSYESDMKKDGNNNGGRLQQFRKEVLEKTELSPGGSGATTKALFARYQPFVESLGAGGFVLLRYSYVLTQDNQGYGRAELQCTQYAHVAFRGVAMARGRGVTRNRKQASPAVDSRVARASTRIRRTGSIMDVDGVQIVMINSRLVQSNICQKRER
jgi:hypothetical protein